MLSGVLLSFLKEVKKIFIYLFIFTLQRTSKYLLKFTLTVKKKSKSNQKTNLFGLSVDIACSTTL